MRKTEQLSPGSRITIAGVVLNPSPAGTVLHRVPAWLIRSTVQHEDWELTRPGGNHTNNRIMQNKTAVLISQPLPSPALGSWEPMKPWLLYARLGVLPDEDPLSWRVLVWYQQQQQVRPVLFLDSSRRRSGTISIITNGRRSHTLYI